MTDFVSRICGALRDVGVECVFGVPGTQNVALFEGLRAHRLRTVLATDERSAAFMANGYFRATGRVAALTTIPGPGFAYALPGLAEARLDSAALLHIVGRPASAPGHAFQLQAIDQRAVAAPLVKACVELTASDDPAAVIRHAYTLATAGGPGPVMVHVDFRAALDAVQPTERSSPTPEAPSVTSAALDEIERLFTSARRPLFYLGAGALGAAARLEHIATSRLIPVLTTPSARGLIPEDHALAMGFDPPRGHVDEVNRLLDASDLVVALGCRLSHNGSAGFELRLSPEKLVHVDADAAVPGANYATRLSLVDTVERVVPVLERRAAPTDWSANELRGWREALRAGPDAMDEPVIRGERPLTPAEFFHRIRALLPRDAIVVTDSGVHQVLARRHLRILSPRGLVFPSDMQSVGFGLPAAIGARLAAPRRPVLAIVGDGGFLMSGFELLTARRERVPLAVMVFNDGHLNQVRMAQQRDFGRTNAVDLLNPDYAVLADALGVEYLRFDTAPPDALRAAFTASRVTLIEVHVGDSMARRRTAVVGRAKAIARTVVQRVRNR